MTDPRIQRLSMLQHARERRAAAALRRERQIEAAALARLEDASLLAARKAETGGAARSGLYAELLGKPVGPAALERCNRRVDELLAAEAEAERRASEAKEAAAAAKEAVAIARSAYQAGLKRSRKWRRIAEHGERQAGARRTRREETEAEEVLSDRAAALGPGAGRGG